MSAMALSSTMALSLPQSSMSLSHCRHNRITILIPSSSLRRRGGSSIRCSTISTSNSAAAANYQNKNIGTNGVDGGGGGGGVLDCVIVGGGISGLCIAQALSTKYSNLSTNFIVTEAKDRVGGNITTMEADGYLWEEGPNSFQPSDAVLTMAVSLFFPNALFQELII